MKIIPPALQSRLEGDTRLATLVRVTRVDGTVLGFTSFDRDLTFEGVTYRADGSFALEALQEAADLKSREVRATGLLQSTAIDEADLKAGLYDHARIDLLMVAWDDPAAGAVFLRRGWLGEVALQDGVFVAAFRGLHDLLQRKIGTCFTPECRHSLGDALCGAAAARFSGTVSAADDTTTFYDFTNAAADGFFDYGLVTWTSGANQGLSMEVKHWDGAQQLFSLWLPMPYPIAAGDAYTATAGCDKRFATCKTKFNNAAAFGGFPHLPGLSKILAYPESS